MDDLDIAAEREQLDRSLALQVKRPTGPEPMGRCHHCDSDLPDTQRWCGAECRDAWSFTQTQRARR